MAVLSFIVVTTRKTTRLFSPPAHVLSVRFSQNPVWGREHVCVCVRACNTSVFIYFFILSTFSLSPSLPNHIVSGLLFCAIKLNCLSCNGSKNFGEDMVERRKKCPSENVIGYS